MATRVEVSHQIVPSNAHQETEMSIVDALLFPLLFSLNHQPTGWWYPHSELVLTPSVQLSL